jgi:hypothetical protein
MNQGLGNAQDVRITTLPARVYVTQRHAGKRNLQRYKEVQDQRHDKTTRRSQAKNKHGENKRGRKS